MDWITVIWSAAAGACLILGLTQFVVWCGRKHAWENLWFSVATVGVIGLIACELLTMKAASAAEYANTVRWAHLIFLIVCGLIPKIGAIINTVPINVLGGGVIVMFGMVCASGVNMLSEVKWNRRNMVIFAIALSVSFGLQLEPSALQHLGKTAQILLTSGLLPAAFIAIVLNLVLPEDID